MVSINSTGGIFWRLDSSGNLTGYDTTGTVLAKFISGVFSGNLNKATIVSNTAIASTSSTTGVYTGWSAQITPQISGNVLILLAQTIQGGTAGDSYQVYLSRKNGTSNPAGGAAETGSTLTAVQLSGSGVVANFQVPATLVWLDTGLTIGQALTYSVAAKVITAATTVTFQGGNPAGKLSAYEI